MNLFKPAIALPLCVSLGLHAAMGLSIGRHWSSPSAHPNREPIQISYAESPKPVKPPLHQAAVPSVPSVPRKKIRGIPVPRASIQEEPAQTPQSSEFEKKMEAKLEQQQQTLAKLNIPTPKSSAEMLADPKKGKIFVEYFTEVRRKIQETLSQRYARRYSVRGGVSLGFVLSSKGFLEKVAVLAKGTDGDERLQELAVQCLREAAPFGAFPPELGSDRIAFNVTLFFVDR